MIHVSMMKHALTLSQQSRNIAPPNPWVGCVIEKDGHIIGEGSTQKPGSDHAEVVALKLAGSRAKNATAYVTLEPCAHFGRTPPCTNALIEAGISRVVIGIHDPDKRVQGKGIAKLREAGIEVIEGVLSTEISQCLAAYLHHRQTGLPFCLLKAAISIDGRLAAKDGTSKWISSYEARLDAHQIRAESQAILIGAGTAYADQPALTVRGVEMYPLPPPLRVILDSRGTLLPKGPLFDVALAPTLMITSSNCSHVTKENWKASGVEVEMVASGVNGKGVDLKEVLFLLGKRGILQVMVEGGGLILNAFLKDHLANQLTLYLGSCILGGSGIPLFLLDSIATLQESIKLELLRSKILGNSIRLDYQFQKKSITQTH